jgi:dephospho-CoA kinase
MMKVGITGGIGSGKSVVSKIFSTLGIPVYEADLHAKMLMNTDPDIRRGIIENFGKDAYNNDGTLNRDYLAKIVFEDPAATARINSVVHPAVGRDFIRWSARHDAPYVIKEAALMIQAGSYKQLGCLIVVTAPEELRIQRVVERDSHRTEEDVKKIIARQMPEEEMIKYADYVLDNSGKTPVLNKVLELDKKFRN